MAERRPGGEFRKQCNISKSYHEEFLICRNRVDQFQGNAIYLNAYGESRIAPGGVTRMTCQGKSFFSQWCIELIEEGSGEFISRSLREPLQPGSLCIIRSDMMAEIHAAPDTPLFKRVLMVEKSSLVSLLCMHDFSRENEVLRLTEPKRIENIYDEIKRICCEGGGDLQMRLSVLVYRFFLEISRQRHPWNRKRTLQSLLRRILSNPAEDYSRENMARMLGVNIRTLTRRFSDAVGCSPTNFVIQARMRSACELLESGALPVHMVAEACGYQSTAFFSREFRKYSGMTPREYREKQGASRTDLHEEKP